MLLQLAYAEHNCTPIIYAIHDLKSTVDNMLSHS
jgi:hypothetical protein